MKQGAAIIATLGAMLVTAWPSLALGQDPTPPATTPTEETPPASTTRVLSDELTLSRWAYPASKAKIRSAPRKGARRVGHLRFLTEDRFPELYLLLAERRDSKGRKWVQLRIPGRPNGRKGWVSRGALGEYRKVTTMLKVDRRKLRATLYKNGKVVMTAPVGVGKRGTITPAGRFWVREKFRVRSAPVYGPYAIGTSAYAPHLTDWPNGGVIGLHGTNEPGLVPGRPSHGCIRLHNRDITRLYRRMPVGTPLRVV